MVKQFAGLAVLALLLGSLAVLGGNRLSAPVENLAAVSQTVPNDAVSEVALVREKNTKVLRVLADHEKASPAGKAKLKLDLVEATKDRQQAMLKLLKKNPRAVLDNRLSKSDRTRLPAEAREYVEDDASLIGQLAILHIDGIEYRDSKYEYSVRTTDKKEIKLHFIDGKVPDTQAGRRISTAGLQLADNLILNGDSQSRQFTQLEANARLNVTGAKKLAIILINFTDNQAQPVSGEEIRQQVFTGDRSTNKYYQENSYGQLSLVGANHSDGDIFGWYTIAMRQADGCESDAWNILAQREASRDGFVATNYDMVSIVFPATSLCNWGGLGYIGGNLPPIRSWINYGIGSATYTISTFAHEFGHNLGLRHAGSALCVENGQNTISQGDCHLQAEYGDTFDVMGTSQDQTHFGASAKDYLGWLGANTREIGSATPVSSLVLSPIEQKADGKISAIKIPYLPGDPLGGSYFLEYRSPLGFDAGMSVSGVLLKMANDRGGYGPWLLDGNPQTPTAIDARLPIGQNILLPKSGINLRVLSVGPSGANVVIGSGNSPYINLHVHHLVGGTELQDGDSLTSGETVSIDWSAANQATSCKTTGAWYQAYPTLPASGQRQFTFTTPGSYDLGLVCTNSSGEASGSIQLNVLASGALVINSPAGGESWPAGSRQVIRWAGGQVNDSVSIYLFKFGQQDISGALLASGPNDGLESVLLPIDTVPGNYKIEIRTGGIIADSSLFYISSPVPVVELTAKGKTGLVEVGPNENLQINWNAKYANSCSILWNDSSNRPWSWQDQPSSGTFSAPWLLSVGEKADVKVTCAETVYYPGFGRRDLGPRGTAKLTIKSVNLADQASLAVTVKATRPVLADKSGQITLPYELTLRNVSSNFYPYACFYLVNSNDPNLWKRQVEKVFLGCKSIELPLANPTTISDTLYAYAQQMPHNAYYLATYFGSENNYLLHFTSRLEFSFRNVTNPPNNPGPSGGNSSSGSGGPTPPPIVATTSLPTTTTTPPPTTVPPPTTPAVPPVTPPSAPITPPPATPSITVTSPNGGESFLLGQTLNITWDSTSLTGAKVNIYLSNAVGKSAFITRDSVNNDSFSWTIPQSLTYIGDTVSTPLATGNYRLLILSNSLQNSTGSSVSDWSNNSFTLTSPTAQASSNWLASIWNALGGLLSR